MKVVVFAVGPQESGKTAISNHVAELSESLSSTEYHPTVGVRILEFERKITADPKKSQKWREAVVEAVELWDCSGNPQYLPLFIPFVQRSHAPGVIFAHRIINAPQRNKLKISNKVLQKFGIAYTSLDQDPDAIKSEFDILLAQAFTQLLEQKEQEENAISKQ
ncbi:hypothetical protein EDD86DRAFT_190383 [Gorgonomyces haynaldii]|nr:hypothetical protein EDD86DRAFT_190383 [Gorgonomyces haynaldii]